MELWSEYRDDIHESHEAGHIRGRILFLACDRFHCDTVVQAQMLMKLLNVTYQSFEVLS